MNSFLDNFFKLKENDTNVKTEFIAGVTTFMTMAYILIVNPSILSAAGMDSGAVFTATAVSAIIATLIAFTPCSQLFQKMHMYRIRSIFFQIFQDRGKAVTHLPAIVLHKENLLRIHRAGTVLSVQIRISLVKQVIPALERHRVEDLIDPGHPPHTPVDVTGGFLQVYTDTGHAHTSLCFI